MKRFIFLALSLAFLAAPAVEANGGGVRTSSFFFSTRVVAVQPTYVQPLVFQSFAVDPCCNSSAAFFNTRSFNTYGARSFNTFGVNSFNSFNVNVNAFRSSAFGSRVVVRNRGFFFGSRTVIRGH